MRVNTDFTTRCRRCRRPAALIEWTTCGMSQMLIVRAECHGKSVVERIRLREVYAAPDGAPFLVELFEPEPPLRRSRFQRRGMLFQPPGAP